MGKHVKKIKKSLLCRHTSVRNVYTRVVTRTDPHQVCVVVEQKIVAGRASEMHHVCSLKFQITNFSVQFLFGDTK